jgi:hypothetical protein
MKPEHDDVDMYLKGIVVPECDPGDHRSRLRAELLARVERGQAGTALRGKWKTVALILGLVAAGAAATELAIQVHRYYFEGRASDGSYHFTTQPEIRYQGTYVDAQGIIRTQAVTHVVSTTVSMDGKELDAAGIEQKRRDLEEIDALRQKNERQLLTVIDTQVNGKPQVRVFTYRYQLADGRNETMNENDLSSAESFSAAEAEQQERQIEEARLSGRRDVTRVVDTDLDGQIQRTLICSYVLADGREVTRGEGDPDLAPPARSLTPEQQRELSRLTSLKQGKLVGQFDAALYGKTFTFVKYSFRLPDGTEVTRSEGEPQGLKSYLTGADWTELRELRKTGAGQALAEYDAQVEGQWFRFKPVRYTLSDGTQVVQSRGQSIVNR